MTDAIGVYELRSNEIDHAHMDHWAVRIGVAALWEEIKRRAEPLRRKP